MESGLYAVIGAFVGGLFSFLASQRGWYVSSLERELERIKKTRNLACQQVKAYYQLECRYVAEVAALMNQPEQTVRVRFRDDVENEFGTRPSWTARDAEEKISEL
jgi:hypothetical protein